jgi:hypothetical protein
VGGGLPDSVARPSYRVGMQDTITVCAECGVELGTADPADACCDAMTPLVLDRIGGSVVEAATAA